jgi:hypothetical protein
MPLDFPAYSPSLFIDRETEIAHILKKARTLASGTLIPRRSDRVVRFSGFAGLGKTWLLFHLAHLMIKDPEEKIPNAIVLHVKLNQNWLTRYPDTNPHVPYEQATYELLKDLLRQIEQASEVKSTLAQAQSFTLYELGARVQNAIHETQGRQAVVLLVDDLDEVPAAWLGVLEERLLAPLIIQELHVLLVLAGRNVNYNWVTPELKPLSEEPVKLEPLNQEDTCEQIKRLESKIPGAYQFADQIYGLTAGAPGGNWIIASQVGQPPQMPDEADALAQHNAQIMWYVDPDLGWCFYALCVSRRFDTEWMGRLLPIADPRGRAWGYVACRDLIPRLVETRLARAYRQGDEYRYGLDQYLRPRLEFELQKRDLILWQRLHCALLHMYILWVQNPKYAVEAPRWKNEAKYHIQCLRDAGHDPAQCPNIDAQMLLSLSDVDPVKLRQILVTHFNVSELRTLCFDLGINYDDLDGQGIGDKARELVAYFERREDTVRLEQECRKQRPKAFK